MSKHKSHPPESAGQTPAQRRQANDPVALSLGTSRRRTSTTSGSGERVYREEIISRAALLLRLGLPKAETQSRLRSYLAWDFELAGNPALSQEVDRIVNEVYRRSGPGAGAPTL